MAKSLDRLFFLLSCPVHRLVWPLLLASPRSLVLGPLLLFASVLSLSAGWTFLLAIGWSFDLILSQLESETYQRVCFIESYLVGGRDVTSRGFV